MSVHAAVLSVLLVFGVALVVGVAAERLRIPYMVALLLVTLPLPPIQSDETFVQSFLVVLLPTLIFEAAWNLNLKELRRGWLPTAFLSLPGVLVTVFVVGGGLAAIGAMPLLPALLLGAIVAPTDPIAVIATFRRLRVPSELVAIVEGESLFNDGTGVVMFVALAAALTTGVAVAPLAIAGNIVLVSAGGTAIGIAGAGLAFVITRFTRNRDLHVIATVLVAYGSYLGADALHLSGIFAALFGGMMYRWLEGKRGDGAISAHVTTFWSIAAFFANTMVFLTVGARIEFVRVLSHPVIVIGTLVLTIVARLALVYGGLPFFGVKRRAWQHVVALSGIRGGICIALALTLPHGTAYRGDILDAVYGVVGVTIFVQGLALGPLMKRLDLA